MHDEAFESKRFARQTRFAPLGTDGQARLERARVLLVGCGALGGVLAQTLTRSGVGTLVVVDRDLVEVTNLPRQILFEDRHAREGTLKVEAAREALERIGGPTRIETHATHLDANNLDELARGADLVLDGTDNLSTRYLVNDWCVKHGVPWVYAGVVGGGGLIMAVRPGTGPCLRCIFSEPPPTGTLPTCDTAGVILPAVGAIASLQAGIGLRLLAKPDGLEPALLELDAWNGDVRAVRAPREDDCPCCGRREFPWLDAPAEKQAVALCGRNTVQVRGRGPRPDLDRVAENLRDVAREVRRAGPILRVDLGEERMTVFSDGRTLIEGTEDIDRALALYDRYIGA
ncbi:MAG: thiazole biosynthesis adenylyltransferase ThiF [bacterium]|nr:thiazole biosynthesis adenylyltransferase ThiF [bacterium]